MLQKFNTASHDTAYQGLKQHNQLLLCVPVEIPTLLGAINPFPYTLKDEVMKTIQFNLYSATDTLRSDT